MSAYDTNWLMLSPMAGLLGDNNIHELSKERFVGTLVYPVADPAGATLTVREREADPRVTPPGLAWRLVDDRHVEITRPTAPGLDYGEIFEFIYRAVTLECRRYLHGQKPNFLHPESGRAVAPERAESCHC